MDAKTSKPSDLSVGFEVLFNPQLDSRHICVVSYNQKGKEVADLRRNLILFLLLAAVALGGCDSRTTQPVQQPVSAEQSEQEQTENPHRLRRRMKKKNQRQKNNRRKRKRSRKKNSRRKNRRAKNRRKRKANRKRNSRKPLLRSRTRRMTATLRWSSRCMLPASLSRIFHRSSRLSWIPMIGMLC